MNEEIASNPAPEQVPTPVVEGESQETKVVETPVPEAKEESKPDKKDGFQKAMDRQTRKYYQEKARADALEAQLRGSQGSQAQAPNPNDAPDRSRFNSDEDYNIALIDHRANKIADAKLAQVKQSEQAKAVRSKWDTDSKEVRKIAEDFDEVIPDFFESENFTPAVDRAAMESDRPASVIHYLATHEDEAAKIAGMSDYRVAIEIGKIEAKLATKKEAPKKASAAPEPITPIGSKGGSGEIDPEKESPREYAARRNKELASKGKR